MALLRSLEAERRRRLARRSLTDFAKLCGYNPAPHHELLIEALEGLTRHEYDVLLVEMPPGSAKSTYVNWLFPAWFFGQEPDANVLSASHSSELAERWGRRTRGLLAEHGNTFGVHLAGDSQAAGRWGTDKGGEYLAVGVGVGIMGFRADLGIIDDPFGSREDAESKRIRDNVWEWYTNSFLSRFKPGARRVIMHQRFHEDDLAGRVVAQMKAINKPFRRLKIRAEALLDDPLGRPPGEFLWDDPDGYNYGQFLRDRKAESDTRTWSALYQQEPTPDTGDYFKREWLHTIPNLPAREALRIYGASDYAVTANGGDYTVHIVAGIDSKGTLYILDLWRSQSDSAEWVEAMADLVLKWRPLEWAEETGQIRAGVGPFLTKRLMERRAFVHRRQFPTRGDKAVRAQAIRGRMSMRGLYLPERAPWIADFESELLRFPAGVHDDQADALGLIGQLLDTIHAPSEPSAPTASQSTGYKSQTRSAGSWRV